MRGIDMNTYVSQELTRSHQADLMREADRTRLAKVARQARVHSTPEPRWSGKRRLVLAIGGAAAAMIATAAAVLAG
jgi:hypothetical protein